MFEVFKDKMLKEIVEIGFVKVCIFVESYVVMNGVDEVLCEVFYLCLGDYIGSKDG